MKYEVNISYKINKYSLSSDHINIWPENNLYSLKCLNALNALFPIFMRIEYRIAIYVPGIYILINNIYLALELGM